MGRSSKPEQSNETSPYQGQTSNLPYQYANNSQPVPSRGGAISESESMARDIKEGRLSGFVGNGTVLTGETNFQAMLRVDGHLTGRVTSENGTLIIGSTGRVDANISVAAALINGVINGDIIAAEKIELGRTARVAGNIQTPRLVMEDGAILEGGCTMVKARENAEKRVAEANSQIAAVPIESPNYQTVETEESQYPESDSETDDETDDEEFAESARS